MLLVATLIAACSHHATLPASPKVTIYYCKVGSDELVRMPFSVDPKLSAPSLATYALNQLLAGPSVGRDSLVLFPAGTQATVTVEGGVATVDLEGAVTRSFQSGGAEEAGLFKSLTYTLTGLPGITSVQVLVAGQKRASLPGGQFEIDEPLTRDTFAQ